MANDRRGLPTGALSFQETVVCGKTHSVLDKFGNHEESHERKEELNIQRKVEKKRRKR